MDQKVHASQAISKQDRSDCFSGDTSMERLVSPSGLFPQLGPAAIRIPKIPLRKELNYSRTYS